MITSLTYCERLGEFDFSVSVRSLGVGGPLLFSLVNESAGKDL